MQQRSTSGAPTEEHVRYGLLQSALNEVDPELRRVLTLRFFGRRSTAEIALALRCTEAHVRMLQMQALVELQRRILNP